MPNSSAGWPDIRAAGRKGGGTFGRDLVVFVPVHADFLVNCVGVGNVYLQFDGGKFVCILLGPAKTCISG